MMPLAFAQLGQNLIIQRVAGNPAMKKHLQNLGFIPGNSVTVLNSLSGNVIVSVMNSRIAISKEMAQKIMIQA